MRYVLLLILTAIIICSCGRKSLSPDDVIDLFDSPRSEIKNLSEIATNVEYIPLQTTENSLISFINDIKTFGDKIYVFNSSQVLCFDQSGTYLYNLDNQGRGPEEYTYIYDWDISPENKILIILIRGKALFYDETKDGFVYSKALNFKDQPSNIDLSPDQEHILCSFGSTSGDEPFRYVILNLDGDTLKTISNHYNYIKNSNLTFIAKWENISFNSNNTLHFKYCLSDTVFTLDQSNNILPYIRFDSHGKQATTETFANFSMDTFFKYPYVGSIFETSRYLFYMYHNDKTLYLIILDKITHEKKNIFIAMDGDQPEYINDDIIGGVDFEPKFCVDDILYSWVDALTLKDYVTSEKFKNSIVKNPEKKEDIKKLADSLDESGNPVLIVVTPKK